MIYTIHATMTREDENLSFNDVAKRDIKFGYCGIGYHLVITRDGLTYKGRDPSIPSPHDKPSEGEQLVSVCLVGGCDSRGNPQDNFTSLQKGALFGRIMSARECGGSFRIVTPSLKQEDFTVETKT